MNDSFEWKEKRGKIVLYHGNAYVLSIHRINNPDFPTYRVELPIIDMRGTIVANSIEEAKWRAVLMLSDECNKFVHKYMYIRDHLPDIRQLYDDYMSVTSFEPIWSEPKKEKLNSPITD